MPGNKIQKYAKMTAFQHSFPIYFGLNIFYCSPTSNNAKYRFTGVSKKHSQFHIYRVFNSGELHIVYEQKNIKILKFDKCSSKHDLIFRYSFHLTVHYFQKLIL